MNTFASTPDDANRQAIMRGTEMSTATKQIIKARAYVFNPQQAGVNEIVRFVLGDDVNPQGDFKIISIQRDGESPFYPKQYAGRYPCFPVHYDTDVCNASVEIEYIAPAYPFVEQSALVEIPDMLAEKNAQIAKLESQLATANAANEKHSRIALDLSEKNAQFTKALELIKYRAERPSSDPFDAPADILAIIESLYGSAAFTKQSPAPQTAVKKCTNCKEPLADDTPARFGSHGAIYLCPLCTEELES